MTSTEEPFLLAISENPDDAAPRAIYADWLEERGDPRGEYLRLIALLSSLQKGDPQIAVAMARLRGLRPSLDRHWAAIIDDFDGRVREVRTLKLRTYTYGSAPKKYSGATKVGLVERALLVRAGWQHAGDGRGYSYVRRPEGVKAKDPIIPAEVPTDPEIERMALGFHRQGEKAIRIFGPWIVQYRPADSVRYRTRIITDPDVEAPWEEVRGPAQFEFGVGAPWGATLTWEAGNDVPSWTRNASQEVA